MTTRGPQRRGAPEHETATGGARPQAGHASPVTIVASHHSDVSTPDPRLLVVTGLWPTPDVPSAGVFVQRRLEGVPCTVVGPTTYRTPMPSRVLGTAWRALTVRGRFYGVEAHVVFPTGLIGLAAARWRGLPLVLVAHGSDVRVTAHENALYRHLARFVVRQADAVIANSRATADLVRELGGDAEVVYPGVDLSRFRPTPRVGSRRVLYLGGASETKGYVVARVHADTLVGPGIKTVPPDEIPALIASHDVVLVPSKSEGFGIVAAEAIASGRWVVASDVGGLAEVVQDGVNGTLVSDGDFGRALAAVPPYSPSEVAATVAQYGLERQRAEMAALWTRVLARRRRV